MKSLLELFHIHSFNTPVASEYRSFNIRRIIYQCKCGCKKSERVNRPFDSNIDFPIKLSCLIGKEDFEDILENPNPIKPLLTFQDEIDYIENRNTFKNKSV